MSRLGHRFTRELDRSTPGHYRLRVCFVTEGNEMVVFMLQYETLVGNIWLPVIRYDTSYGEAHRDTYAPSGEQVDKQWLGITEPPFNTLFTAKYDELDERWPRYFQAFLNRGGSSHE